VYWERAAAHGVRVDKALRAATVKQAIHRETIYLNDHGGFGELVQPGLVQGGSGCQQRVSGRTCVERKTEKVGERIWASQNGGAHGSHVGRGEEDGGGEASRRSIGGHVPAGAAAGCVCSGLEAAGSRDGGTQALDVAGPDVELTGPEIVIGAGPGPEIVIGVGGARPGPEVEVGAAGAHAPMTGGGAHAV